MLRIVAPGKLVLTLQSIPPFVVESFFALTLVVLLALPLIVHVQRFLDKPSKSSLRTIPASSRPRNRHDAERSYDRASRTLVMHYPAPIFIDSASSSSVNLHLESDRKTISTPALHGTGDAEDNHEDRPCRIDLNQDQPKANNTIPKRNDTLLERSSSFVATNSELPIIDISSFDYDAYRHKLIESTLRKQYDDFQPPGNVVLNSIHLNTNDSMIGVRLNGKYDHSFFDFIEEFYDATKSMCRKETEYMHPMDHFLVRGTQKADTREKETETSFQQDDDPSNRLNTSAFTARTSYERQRTIENDTNRSRTSTPKTSQINRANKLGVNLLHTDRRAMILEESGKLQVEVKDRLKTGKTLDKRIHRNIPDSQHVGNLNVKLRGKKESVAIEEDSKSQRTSSRIAAKKKVIRKSRSRVNSSTDESVCSKRETISVSQKAEEGRETLSSAGEKESVNCTSVSSIESESIYSDSSKLRDEKSARSRDSSVASGGCTSSKPQSLLAGNPKASFNRKYGSVAKFSSPERMKSLATKKLENTVKDINVESSSRFSYTGSNLTNQSVKLKKRIDSSTIESSSNSKTHSFLAKSRKVKEDTQDDRSEGSEGNKKKSRTVTSSDLSSKKAFRGDRLSSKLLSETFQTTIHPSIIETSKAAVVPVSESSPEGLSRLTTTSSKDTSNRRLFVERGRSKDSQCSTSRTKSSSKQGEKFVKLLGGRKQRSRTGSSVLSKVDILSPKIELSTEMLTDELCPDIAINFKRDQSQGMMKKSGDGSGRTLEDSYGGSLIAEDTESKGGRISKKILSNLVLNGETKSDSKGTNKDRDKGMKVLKKNSLSVNCKLSSISKTSKQNVDSYFKERTDAKINSGLNDVGARSQIKSHKYLSEGKKDEGDARGMKVEIDRKLIEETRLEELKLPRRDSKVGIAMQEGLKKYINKMKDALIDHNKVDNIDNLASLTLTDAIIPDLESSLSSAEVRELQNLLSIAEMKSDLIYNDVSATVQSNVTQLTT